MRYKQNNAKIIKL